MMTRTEKDYLSVLALVGANLLPLAGVFFFGWGVTFIVLLYWIENLIAGFFNILKITFLQTEKAADRKLKLFIIPFFCLHYGGFCAGHGFFLTSYFKIGSDISPLANSTEWWGPFVLLQLLYSIVAKLWISRPPEMIWAVLGLTVSHGVSFVENYILGREYRTGSISKLMHKPYQRIIVMHIAIIAGGIFIMKLNSPMPLLIILVILKIFFDLFLHRKSHRQTDRTGHKTLIDSRGIKEKTEDQ